MKKLPLLALLQENYPHKSKKELYAHILCGDVSFNNETLKDPKLKIDTTSNLLIEPRKYISRGGLKIEYALDAWSLPIEGSTLLDAGCGAGGFTDCLLQKGASLVYAVDVGYNILNPYIRNHALVKAYEKTNIMSITSFNPPPRFAVADLSFRSILGAAEHIISLTKDKTLIGLIKPQFEESGTVQNFDGVIYDEKASLTILNNVITELKKRGIETVATLPSPIKGKKGGNQEYLCYLKG